MKNDEVRVCCIYGKKFKGYGHNRTLLKRKGDAATSATKKSSKPGRKRNG